MSSRTSEIRRAVAEYAVSQQASLAAQERARQAREALVLQLRRMIPEHQLVCVDVGGEGVYVRLTPDGVLEFGQALMLLDEEE
jgi:hypothetical protein